MSCPTQFLCVMLCYVLPHNYQHFVLLQHQLLCLRPRSQKETWWFLTNVDVLFILSLLSLPPKKGSQNLCLVFNGQTGHLGIKMVHGFWALLGWWKEHRLSGGGSAKGFCTGDLGRTIYFRVVAIGSQQIVCKLTNITLTKSKKVLFSGAQESKGLSLFNDQLAVQIVQFSWDFFAVWGNNFSRKNQFIFMVPCITWFLRLWIFLRSLTDNSEQWKPIR